MDVLATPAAGTSPYDRSMQRLVAEFVDGPHAGSSPRWHSPGHAWPQSICTQVGRGEWAHYAHLGLGRYRYAGPCAEQHADAPR